MDPAPDRPSREPWIFLAACVVCGLAFQGSRGLFETDEGRYAECAREMLTSRQWLLPTLQGIPHLTKPPGAYWLIAAGLEVLGRNEWGARVALGLAFGAAAWLVRVIGRVLLGDPGGARSGWIYLGMAYPFAAGTILTTDTFLVAFELGSLACLVRAATTSRQLGWCCAAGCLLHAAVFVKGHPALLPWSAFVAALALSGRARGGRWWLGVTLALLIGVTGFWWYLYVAGAVPGASEQFGKEVTSRLTGTGDHHARPLWYYPGLLMLGTLPWWVPLVRGVRRAGTTDVGRMLLVWGGVTFLVFEVVPAKMPLYVLPMAAPLALWAGHGARNPGSPWPARPWALGAWLALLCGLRFFASGALPEDERDMRLLADAARRADPSGEVPVAINTGADLQGFDFYLDGRPSHVRSVDVPTERGTRYLSEEAATRAANGQTWLLVVDDEPEAVERVRRIAGAAAQVAECAPGYLIYRIVPERR